MSATADASGVFWGIEVVEERRETVRRPAPQKNKGEEVALPARAWVLAWAASFAGAALTIYGIIGASASLASLP